MAPKLDGSLLCPFDLTVDQIAAFANAEIADHPVYDGFELQWFDDASHGTGLLAFLSRRADRRVDYYVEPSLRLDRSGYEIGGGPGTWTETNFQAGELQVSDDGVFADVRFEDVEGREIEVSFDDRDRRRRHASDLLAPFGSDIAHPGSLLLVYLHGFDLLRKGRQPPLVRIDGRSVPTGKLPGAFLHRRHLIKAAAPFTVAAVCRQRSGPLRPVDPTTPGGVQLTENGDGIVAVTAAHAGAHATFRLDPPLGRLRELAEGRPTAGRWQVEVDGAAVTGGVWLALRHGPRVDLALDVTQPWAPPAGLPLMMRVATHMMPVFRRWPTTYRWTAEIRLDSTPATIASRWERTGTGGGDSYRRATHSMGSSV